jgi:small subunit ribosomal protein S6
MALEFKKSEKMRPYESIIIMDPNASEQDQKALFNKNKEIVEGFKGSMYSVETWGKRPLANPIEKHQVGTYFHSYFTADPSAIVELERTMKINEKVLRYMHTRLNDKQTVEKHAEDYKQVLKDSNVRQQEAELRMQKKRAARAQRGPGKRERS